MIMENFQYSQCLDDFQYGVSLTIHMICTEQEVLPQIYNIISPEI